MMSWREGWSDVGVVSWTEGRMFVAVMSWREGWGDVGLISMREGWSVVGVMWWKDGLSGDVGAMTLAENGSDVKVISLTEGCMV